MLLSGVRPQHAETLRRLGAYEHLLDERHVFPTTPEAIAHARHHAARLPQP